MTYVLVSDPIISIVLKGDHGFANKRSMMEQVILDLPKCWPQMILLPL